MANQRLKVLEHCMWRKVEGGSSEQPERGTILVEEWGTISKGKAHWSTFENC